MLIVDLLTPLFRALWRVVNVWRKTPEQSHTATEYADAFLFPEEVTRPADWRLSPSAVGARLAGWIRTRR